MYIYIYDIYIYLFIYLYEYVSSWKNALDFDQRAYLLPKPSTGAAYATAAVPHPVLLQKFT
jgi:hypothetical protein